MRQEYYNSIEDKKRLSRLANQIGESTIHDDFIDINNKPTNGQSGRLTFDKIADPPKRNRKTTNQLNQLLKDKQIEYIDLLYLIEDQALKLTSSRWENFRSLFTG